MKKTHSGRFDWTIEARRLEKIGALRVLDKGLNGASTRVRSPSSFRLDTARRGSGALPTVFTSPQPRLSSMMKPSAFRAKREPRGSSVRSIPEVVVLSKPPYGGRNLLAKSLSFYPCRSPSTGEESSIRSERSGPSRLSPGFAPAENKCP